MASYTYTAVGNKIDWSEIISNISPSETVTYSMFGKGKAKAMTHNWLTDTLAVPGENMNLEDADLATVAATPRVQLSNDIQIFMRGYFVTDFCKMVGLKSISNGERQTAQHRTKTHRDVDEGLTTVSRARTALTMR